MSGIERAGWMTEHPVKGRPVHVVTREWFDEVREQAHLAEAEVYRLREQLRDAEDLLREIAESDAVDNALDPDRNRRIARSGFARRGPVAEGPVPTTYPSAGGES